MIEAGVFLFRKTLYDFNPYLKNPDEQEKLINMPITVKKVLREIITSKIFSKLILENEYKKAEEKRKEKIRRREERKKQLIERAKPIRIEDENYENNLKLLKNKRSLNTSCFNQRSIPTLNQYYNSVNEMMCIKETVLNKIRKIEVDSVISCIELENNNKIVHDKFIFMNPKNKGKIMQTLSMPKINREKNESKYKTSRNNFFDNNDMILTRGFMSLDNYYKFIKNNLDKINENDNKLKKEITKKNIKIHDDNKKREKDKRVRTRNRFMIFNTDNRDFELPQLKKSATIKNQMNFILLNKDVKFQVQRSVNNHKKLLNKEKQFLIYNDFDYKNILSLFK
jgi:hypothetical protein